jgi:DNA-binding response OmpR family regulator
MGHTVVTIGRILVADDEPALLDAMIYALQHAGFDIEAAASGEEALAKLASGSFDVVVLDVMLPGKSGFEVCEEIRSHSDVPIIMLTARDGESDRVRGLDVGADDYITKPYSTKELVSRVRAIVRRRQLDGSSQRLRLGDIEIERLARRVTVGSTVVSLTPSEYEILVLLARSPGVVLSRRTIKQHLWGSEFIGDERVCDVHIYSLRQKIARGGGDPSTIATIRGEGYQARPS